jgi:hypothetical protein
VQDYEVSRPLEPSHKSKSINPKIKKEGGERLI